MTRGGLACSGFQQGGGEPLRPGGEAHHLGLREERRGVLARESAEQPEDVVPFEVAQFPQIGPRSRHRDANAARQDSTRLGELAYALLRHDPPHEADEQRIRQKPELLPEIAIGGTCGVRVCVDCIVDLAER